MVFILRKVGETPSMTRLCMKPGGGSIIVWGFKDPPQLPSDLLWKCSLLSFNYNYAVFFLK